jgi:hypothetical protein
LHVLIEQELSALTQSLQAGRDVAPARRARQEGLLAAALAAGAATPAALRQHIQARLPAGSCVDIADNGGAVRLHVWQKRAPVHPSTAD